VVETLLTPIGSIPPTISEALINSSSSSVIPDFSSARISKIRAVMPNAIGSSVILMILPFSDISWPMESERVLADVSAPFGNTFILYKTELNCAPRYGPEKPQLIQLYVLAKFLHLSHLQIITFKQLGQFSLTARSPGIIGRLHEVQMGRFICLDDIRAAFKVGI